MLELPTPRPHGKPDLKLHDRELSEVFESMQDHHLRALGRLTQRLHSSRHGRGGTSIPSSYPQS